MTGGGSAEPARGPALCAAGVAGLGDGGGGGRLRWVFLEGKQKKIFFLKINKKKKTKN